MAKVVHEDTGEDLGTHRTSDDGTERPITINGVQYEIVRVFKAGRYDEEKTVGVRPLRL